MHWRMRGTRAIAWRPTFAVSAGSRSACSETSTSEPRIAATGWREASSPVPAGSTRASIAATDAARSAAVDRSGRPPSRRWQRPGLHVGVGDDRSPRRSSAATIRSGGPACEIACLLERACRSPGAPGGRSRSGSGRARSDRAGARSTPGPMPRRAAGRAGGSSIRVPPSARSRRHRNRAWTTPADRRVAGRCSCSWARAGDRRSRERHECLGGDRSHPEPELDRGAAEDLDDRLVDLAGPMTPRARRGVRRCHIDRARPEESDEGRLGRVAALPAALHGCHRQDAVWLRPEADRRQRPAASDVVDEQVRGPLADQRRGPVGPRRPLTTTRSKNTPHDTAHSAVFAFRASRSSVSVAVADTLEDLGRRRGQPPAGGRSSPASSRVGGPGSGRGSGTLPDVHGERGPSALFVTVPWGTKARPVV